MRIGEMSTGQAQASQIAHSEQVRALSKVEGEPMWL
jgi:hypothetical protein